MTHIFINIHSSFTHKGRTYEHTQKKKPHTICQMAYWSSTSRRLTKVDLPKRHITNGQRPKFAEPKTLVFRKFRRWLAVQCVCVRMCEMTFSKTYKDTPIYSINTRSTCNRVEVQFDKVLSAPAGHREVPIGVCEGSQLVVGINIWQVDCSGGGAAGTGMRHNKGVGISVMQK